MLETRTRSLVGSLFLPSGPLAIVWLIAFVVVDPLYRHLWMWTATHVCNKIRETRTPLRAHLYSASTVVTILGVVFVVTSLLHAMPDPILWPLVQARSGSMFV
jgi:hypothetical protein